MLLVGKSFGGRGSKAAKRLANPVYTSTMTPSMTFIQPASEIAPPPDCMTTVPSVRKETEIYRVEESISGDNYNRLVFSADAENGLSRTSADNSGGKSDVARESPEVLLPSILIEEGFGMSSSEIIATNTPSVSTIDVFEGPSTSTTDGSMISDRVIISVGVSSAASSGRANFNTEDLVDVDLESEKLTPTRLDSLDAENEWEDLHRESDMAQERTADDYEWDLTVERRLRDEEKLAKELEFEYIDDVEAASLPRARAGSLVEPLKNSLETAVTMASETIEVVQPVVQPIAESLGKTLLSGAKYAGGVLHDTALDTVDSVAAIPWSELSDSAVKGGIIAAVAIGQTGKKAVQILAATPLGQRIVGGIDTAATTAQLKVAEAVGYALRGALNKLEYAADAVHGHQMQLHERLNPHGLPRGEVVDMEEASTPTNVDWDDDEDEQEDD